MERAFRLYGHMQSLFICISQIWITGLPCKTPVKEVPLNPYGRNNFYLLFPVLFHRIQQKVSQYSLIILILRYLCHSMLSWTGTIIVTRHVTSWINFSFLGEVRLPECSIGVRLSTLYQWMKSKAKRT